MEEYLQSGSVQDALSSYREQKIPDRYLRYILLAIMTQTLDKNGKVAGSISFAILDLYWVCPLFLLLGSVF